jgi:HPt (histidine-containing phosphotransfer) domain-containing protein
MGPSSVRSPIRVDIPAGLEEIIPDYLDSQKKLAGLLEQLLASSELDGIRRIAHNLKNGAAFGFPRLSEIGVSMERSVREANLGELSEQIKSLAEYLDRVQLR